MSDLLIFDGDCGICTFLSEYVQKHSDPRKLEVEPYQVLNLSQLHPELNEEKTSKSLFLLTGNNVLFNRSKGVFEVMKRMSGAYRFFGILLSNPIVVFLTNPIYDWVSKNRTKISVRFGLNACNISKYSSNS
jgi:predicted DCC family thiol-disulfide oxidoreductase YuxK